MAKGQRSLGGNLFQENGDTGVRAEEQDLGRDDGSGRRCVEVGEMESYTVMPARGTEKRKEDSRLDSFLGER